MLLANGHFAGVTPAIFVIFVDFRGARSKIPCFCGQNAISEFSPIFVKTTCFRQGTKRPFSKTTVSTTLKLDMQSFCNQRLMAIMQGQSRDFKWRLLVHTSGPSRHQGKLSVHVPSDWQLQPERPHKLRVVCKRKRTRVNADKQAL